jgi:hypothetical protein
MNIHTGRHVSHRQTSNDLYIYVYIYIYIYIHIHT